MLRIGWDSAAAISSLACPMLFIGGELDTLVPPAHMKRLFDLATGSAHKDFYSVANGTHNDTWSKAGAAYYIRLMQFLLAITARQQQQQRQQIGGTTGTARVWPPTSSSTATEAATVCEDDLFDDDSNTTTSTAIPTMNRNFRVT